MTRSTCLPPAIVLDVILPAIIQQRLCEGDACDLALESNFMNARFLGQQIYHLHTLTLNKFHKRLASKAVARVFNVQPKEVRRALEKGDPIPRGRGDHPAIKEDIEQQLIHLTE
jgi:hypothetical protein